MEGAWGGRQGTGEEEEEQKAGVQGGVKNGGVVPSCFSQLSKWLPGLANIFAAPRPAVTRRTSNYRALWSTLS